MTEVISAPAVPTAPAPIVAPAPVTEMNPSDAARALAARRVELRKQTAEPAAPQEAAPEPPQELAQEANADPQAEAPSEPTEAPEPADLPPIEPPRSWTQAEKERFQSLPRETQEYLHTREQEREREFRRGQNEAAEQRKAYEAEQSKARELQQQYEAKLSQVMQTIQETGPFSDIRTMADLEKLQAEDPFRFQAYQLHQWKLQATQAELQEVENRRTQEKQSKRAAYEAEQNKLLTELVPEMADPNKANDLRTRAVNMLIDDLGLRNEQLSRWVADDTGHEILSNAGIQKLIADGLKYRDIKSAPKAVPQALPPVQRPGVSKPATNSNAGKIQALEKSLNNASGFNQAKIMAEIRMLRRAR